MFKFGDKSNQKLNGCDNRIIQAINHAMGWQIMDYTIVYGHRTPVEQFSLYEQGRKQENGIWVIVDQSKVVTNIDGFNQTSFHNYDPSLAVDIAPFIGGRAIYGNTEIEVKQILCMAGIIQAAFKQLDIKFTWGGNWDGDGEPIADQTFQDYLHFQVPVGG